MTAASAAKDTSPRPVADASEAALLIKHLNDVMDALLGTVEQETEFVRAGKLTEAAKLEPTKSELSRLYVADSTRVKKSQAFLTKALPEELKALRKRHDLFHALLQMNLTVLATAHAVSEGIMRGVSGELARKSMPHGYGATGRAAAPTQTNMQPLTLSRVL